MGMIALALPNCQAGRGARLRMTDSLTMPREAGSRTSHPTRSDPQDAVRCLACPHSALSQPPHFRPTERSQKIGGGVHRSQPETPEQTHEAKAG